MIALLPEPWGADGIKNQVVVSDVGYALGISSRENDKVAGVHFGIFKIAGLDSPLPKKYEIPLRNALKKMGGSRHAWPDSRPRYGHAFIVFRVPDLGYETPLGYEKFSWQSAFDEERFHIPPFRRQLILMFRCGFFNTHLEV